MFYTMRVLQAMQSDAGIRLTVTRAELERAIHAAVSAAAEKQGATVKETRVTMSAPSARAVEFTVDCTAKVFIATAKLTVRGRVEVDDALAARISGLAVSGEGMIAALAQSFLHPHLAKWNDRTIPLPELTQGGFLLRDVRVEVTDDALRIEAELAAAT